MHSNMAYRSVGSCKCEASATQIQVGYNNGTHHVMNVGGVVWPPVLIAASYIAIDVSSSMNKPTLQYALPCAKLWTTLMRGG